MITTLRPISVVENTFFEFVDQRPFCFFLVVSAEKKAPQFHTTIGCNSFKISGNGDICAQTNFRGHSHNRFSFTETVRKIQFQFQHKQLERAIQRQKWIQQTIISCLCSGHCGLNAHQKRTSISHSFNDDSFLHYVWTS